MIVRFRLPSRRTLPPGVGGEGKNGRTGTASPTLKGKIIETTARPVPTTEPELPAGPDSAAPSNRVSFAQVAVYYFFSACAMAIDFGGLALLVRAGVAATIAAGISFLTGSTFHFSANRWLNFKSFDRNAATQARTYFGIVAVAWVITMATIYIVHGIMGYSVLIAKIVSTAITLPMGFLGHRFLTFSAGLRAAVRNIVARVKGDAVR